MTTQNPDLKKLFVYVSFNVTGTELTSAITELVRVSNDNYPDRIFFLENTGEIISHGNKFGVSNEVKEQIATLQTKSANLQTTVKGLTGLTNIPADVKDVTISDTSVIGQYVATKILANKTIVAPKADSGITVEESKDTAGTTTYTVGTNLTQIVDAKSIITKDGKLSSNVELKLVHEDGDHGKQYPFLVLQTKAVTGNADANQNHPSEVISKFDVSEFINDGMIDTVVYDEKTGDLVFTWNTDSTADDSTKTTTINLAKLFNIEGIHSDNEKYITVTPETPGDHDDKGKTKAYHVAAVVDSTDLKTFSSVSHTAQSEGVDEKYTTNYDNNDALATALSKVSGLADSNKVAAKIAQIDKDIVAVGNDAIAREKTITTGIDAKIADLQKQLNDEIANRGNADAALYGKDIPVNGLDSTITGNAAAITILNADENTAGSVAAKIKALKKELEAEVEYKDAHNLVKVAVSQVNGVVSAKENAVTVKTDTLTVSPQNNPEYTNGSLKYSAKDFDTVATSNPSLVTNQDAWIYGQCIKAQAINAINSDDNEYIKIVREDNKTKIKFEPWTEVHTVTELADIDKI